MAMVDVDDSCQFSADSQPKSTGLVWGLAATRRSVYIHQMNRVNSRNDCGHDDSTINIVMAIIILLLNDTRIYQFRRSKALKPIAADFFRLRTITTRNRQTNSVCRPGLLMLADAPCPRYRPITDSQYNRREIVISLICPALIWLVLASSISFCNTVDKHMFRHTNASLWRLSLIHI